MSRLRVLAILVAVLLPTFMTALDNTVVNVALPQIQAELELSEAGLKWVAAIYPLTLASLLLLGGHLADTVGRRATLSLGVALFTVASVGCSAAPSGMALIACRGLQGAGAALILPASLAVQSHDLPPRVRNAAFSATTAALASALACGPVISGVMTQHLGWESVFAMNTPLGCASLLVGFLIPRPGPSARAASPASAALSLRVVVLACCSLAALAYCLIEGPEQGFDALPVAASGGIVVASAVGLSYELTSRRNTVLRLLFRQRPFVGGIITQLLWGLSVSGVYFFTSRFLQNGLGLAPTCGRADIHARGPFRDRNHPFHCAYGAPLGRRPDLRCGSAPGWPWVADGHAGQFGREARRYSARAFSSRFRLRAGHSTNHPRSGIHTESPFRNRGRIVQRLPRGVRSRRNRPGGRHRVVRGTCRSRRRGR